jgi:hypothetical protein
LPRWHYRFLRWRRRSSKLETLQKVDSLKSEVLRGAAAVRHFDLRLRRFNYNRYRDAEHTSKADLRRFVLGWTPAFNDQLTFNSELELEHGVVSKDDAGEVGRAGLPELPLHRRGQCEGRPVPHPLGILNVTHEPPTYYGVERNRSRPASFPPPGANSAQACTACSPRACATRRPHHRLRRRQT